MDLLLAPIRAAIAPYLLWIKLAIAAALVLAIAWLWADRAQLAADNTTLKDNEAVYDQALHSATEALDGVNKQHARDMAALAKDRDAAVARASWLADWKKENARAPASDDGPVAPVLGRALDRLRFARAGKGAGDQGGKDGSAVRPAGLRPQP